MKSGEGGGGISAEEGMRRPAALSLLLDRFLIIPKPEKTPPTDVFGLRVSWGRRKVSPVVDEPLSTLNESDGRGARRLGVLPKEEKDGLLERKGNMVLLGGGVGYTMVVSDCESETER